MIVALAISAALSIVVHAQFPPGPPGPPKTPKESARVDLTGYWVSIVSEDWRFRMITAPKGDYPNVPLNPEGKKVADTWDPAKDEASKDRCKAYGAPNIMRQPGRLHVSWTNDTTLKIDFDAGTQSRLLRFNTSQPPTGASTRQGYSTAEWEGRGSLKVTTTRLLPGYLQTNGVPYSGNAAMTEYFDVVKEPNGDQWLIVETIVSDPQVLDAIVRAEHAFQEAGRRVGLGPEPVCGEVSLRAES